jgi:hypothetical protein
VAHDRDSLDAETEGIAGVPLRIVAHLTEDLGIHHAATADFEPLPTANLTARARAVDLETGLGEGEEVRAETEFQVFAEELAEEVFKCALEIGERDPLRPDLPFGRKSCREWHRFHPGDNTDRGR